MPKLGRRELWLPGVSVCQEWMLGESDCCGGDCVFRAWSKEAESREVKVWGEQISKRLGKSESAVLLARKQYPVFAAENSGLVWGLLLCVDTFCPSAVRWLGNILGVGRLRVAFDAIFFWVTGLQGKPGFEALYPILEQNSKALAYLWSTLPSFWVQKMVPFQSFRGKPVLKAALQLCRCGRLGMEVQVHSRPLWGRAGPYQPVLLPARRELICRECTPTQNERDVAPATSNKGKHGQRSLSIFQRADLYQHHLCALLWTQGLTPRDVDVVGMYSKYVFF